MSEPRYVNPWIVAVAVMFATFMEVLDTTVVNVSLPHIAGTLSASIDEATWALTSYLVANAIILPMTGWLASMFGRKNLLMLSVIGFTATSFLCGLAPTLGSLIFFRILQGATGGALQPLSQAVLLEAFAPQDRGKAMGFWALGIVVAPILGPVLGGWLTDNYSWRWVFYINIPVGIASIVMTKLYIFDPPYLKAESRKVDYWGIGMLAVGIGALQIVLDKGQEEDWFSSNMIVVLSIVAAVTLAALIWHLLVTDEPIVDLRVFKERSYAVGVFLMTVVGFVLYGSMVLLPVMLQTLLGYPPLQAGIAMAPRGIGSFFMMPITGMMTGRFDPRKLLTAGLLVAAALAVSRPRCPARAACPPRSTASSRATRRRPSRWGARPPPRASCRSWAGRSRSRRSTPSRTHPTGSRRGSSSSRPSSARRRCADRATSRRTRQCRRSSSSSPRSHPRK